MNARTERQDLVLADRLIEATHKLHEACGALDHLGRRDLAAEFSRLAGELRAQLEELPVADGDERLVCAALRGLLFCAIAKLHEASGALAALGQASLAAEQRRLASSLRDLLGF